MINGENQAVGTNQTVHVGRFIFDNGLLFGKPNPKQLPYFIFSYVVRREMADGRTEGSNLVSYANLVGGGCERS